MIEIEGMEKCKANYTPLTPLSFLKRTAVVYADRYSIIYGQIRFTWRHTLHRCLRLSSSLRRLGISYGDVVAVLAPNVPAMYELHFAIPMTGAILCTLNTRHNALFISNLLLHSNSTVVFVHPLFLPLINSALALLSSSPLLILIPDPSSPSPPSTVHLSLLNYESLIESEEEYQHHTPVPSYSSSIKYPEDELHPISLNYTSGTTSNPKGVIYTHRGAYLNSMAAIIFCNLRLTPVYLWTVPMFHCNGWCMAWAVAAQGGTNICLRNVTGDVIFEFIKEYGVTDMGGAPTVLNMMVNSGTGGERGVGEGVTVATGGAPPPSQVLVKMEEMGFRVVHAYGLTETYGPGTVNVWKEEWGGLGAEARGKMKARQGVVHLGMDEVDVMNPDNMISVPWDGITIGEIMLRGNTVMGGYLKDIKATKECMRGGWFHTGDLGVIHPDGYIEVKDRAKDIIISGGENISSIDVESALFEHPAVLDAAVVARPDDLWGETPCAFVVLKPGVGEVSVYDIVVFCRSRLPPYMVPKTVIFLTNLPKTSTGKTIKFLLREKAKDMGSLKKVMSSSKL